MDAGDELEDVDEEEAAEEEKVAEEEDEDQANTNAEADRDDMDELFLEEPRKKNLRKKSDNEVETDTESGKHTRPDC